MKCKLYINSIPKHCQLLWIIRDGLIQSGKVSFGPARPHFKRRVLQAEEEPSRLEANVCGGVRVWEWVTWHHSCWKEHTGFGPTPGAIQTTDKATFCHLTTVWLHSKREQVPDWPVQTRPPLTMCAELYAYKKNLYKVIIPFCCYWYLTWCPDFFATV